MKRFVAFVAVVLTIALPSLAQEQFTPSLRSVKIAVDDFDKASSFYGALGMKVGASHGPAVRELIWENGSYNSGIVMVSPDYPGRVNMVRGGTYLMILTPDIAAVAAKLRSAGFPDIGEPRAMGEQVTVLMLRDPDGNQVELMGPPLAK